MYIANRKFKLLSHILFKVKILPIGSTKQHTSYKTVVQNNKTDKNVVKASQGQEEPVERVLHLLAGQGDGGESVANHTK